jgi:hypothetical protein
VRTVLEVAALVLLIGIDGAALVVAVLVIWWSFRHVFRPMFADIRHGLSGMPRHQGCEIVPAVTEEDGGENDG